MSCQIIISVWGCLLEKLVSGMSWLMPKIWGSCERITSCGEAADALLAKRKSLMKCIPWGNINQRNAVGGFKGDSALSSLPFLLSLTQGWILGFCTEGAGKQLTRTWSGIMGRGRCATSAKCALWEQNLTIKYWVFSVLLIALTRK